MLRIAKTDLLTWVSKYLTLTDHIKVAMQHQAVLENIRRLHQDGKVGLQGPGNSVSVDGLRIEMVTDQIIATRLEVIAKLTDILGFAAKQKSHRSMKGRAEISLENERAVVRRLVKAVVGNTHKLLARAGNEEAHIEASINLNEVVNELLAFVHCLNSFLRRCNAVGKFEAIILKQFFYRSPTELAGILAEFPEFRASPGVIFRVLIGNPKMPEKALQKIKTTLAEIEGDPEFSDFHDQRGTILQIVVKSLRDPKKVLRMIQNTIAELEKDPKFAEFRSTPWVFRTVAIRRVKLASAKKSLAKIQKTVAKLRQNPKFQSLLATPWRFVVAAVMNSRKSTVALTQMVAEVAAKREPKSTFDGSTLIG